MLNSPGRAAHRLERHPVQVQLPVRAQTGVAGSVLGWGAYWRQSIDVSLSFSLTSSLSKINISSGED